jgi:hypothetical protein
LASGNDSTGSCSPTSDTVLGAGSYEITATYEGDGTYFGSTSPQAPLTIDQPSTTTAVTPTPSSTTYGNETTESFGVAVTPVGVSGSPTGLVTVMAGSVPVCNFTLVQSDNGVGSCTTSSDTLLGAGPYQITAVYGGDGTYGGSTSPHLWQREHGQFRRHGDPPVLGRPHRLGQRHGGDDPAVHRDLDPGR